MGRISWGPLKNATVRVTYHLLKSLKCIRTFDVVSSIKIELLLIRPANCMAMQFLHSGAFSVTKTSKSKIRCRVWMSNYSQKNLRYVTIHPCHNSNGGLATPPLKLVHEWLITSHREPEYANHLSKPYPQTSFVYVNSPITRLFCSLSLRLTTKKISKLCISVICERNPSVTGDFSTHGQ